MTENREARWLKTDITIPESGHSKESIEDKLATSTGVNKALKKRGSQVSNLEKDEIQLEPLTIKQDSSELLVITKVKKLAAYVITITEKSPKKFRAVFVNRMQNYCLDCLEFLVEANTLKMDSPKNKERRRLCQHNAFVKLKLLGYISFLSLENECILKKQYQQIAMQLSDCINLLVAWRRSDATRNKQD